MWGFLPESALKDGPSFGSLELASVANYDVKKFVLQRVRQNWLYAK